MKTGNEGSESKLILFNEGLARFYATQGKLSSELPVFYNPRMKINRDVAVWLVSKLKPKKICCGMEASGIRPIRFALEAGAKQITANDISAASFQIMKKNVILNQVEDRIELRNINVRDLLDKEQFDYIDIDPFGCPVPYLDSAMRSLLPNGILAITATDTSCLCGRYINACVRKYSSRPMKCGFEKEIGIRIMIAKAQSIAKEHNKTLKPIFIHSSEHFMRAYLRNERCSDNLGYILFCPKCLERRPSDKPVGECCGARMGYAGPLWLGKLWDEELADDFTLIRHIREESRIDSVGFYDTHEIARVKHAESVRVDTLIQSLQEGGFLASRTHFKPEGVRTTAAIKEVIKRSL